MSVWVTFFLAGIATVGTFVMLYGALFGALYLFGILTGKGGPSSAPSMGVVGLGNLSRLGVWVTWDAGQYDVKFYRIQLNHYSPDSRTMEGRMTVTFEPPRSGSFYQEIELTKEFQKLLESTQPDTRSILTVTAKTTLETPLEKQFSLRQLKKALSSTKRPVPKNAEKLELAQADRPDIATLDFSELEARKVKFKRFEDALKAKEAKKKPPPPAPAKGGGTEEAGKNGEASKETPEGTTSEPPKLAAQQDKEAPTTAKQANS